MKTASLDGSSPFLIRSTVYRLPTTVLRPFGSGLRLHFPLGLPAGGLALLRRLRAFLRRSFFLLRLHRQLQDRPLVVVPEPVLRPLGVVAPARAAQLQDPRVA